MLSWDNWDLGSTLRHFVNIAIILINVCPDYCGYVFRKMFLENFTMNCSFTDPGGIVPSIPEEPRDGEGGGRPYLKCLPLLHQQFSFLIVFNSTFNRYFQILLTYVYIYIYIYIYIIWQSSAPGVYPSRGVSEIRDGEDLWQCSRLEIRLNAFRLSTIPQNDSSSSSSSKGSKTFSQQKFHCSTRKECLRFLRSCFYNLKTLLLGNWGTKKL